MSSPFTNPWAEPAWLRSLESPYYSESHRKLQAYARKYIDDNILPHALTWEAQGDCPDEAKTSWINSGLALADIPPRYRPPGFQSIAGIPAHKLDAFHFLILNDEANRFEGGVGIALSGGANAIGLPPILTHGTEAQKQRWVPGLFTRETSFCLGITEPTGGSDVGNIRTRAVKSPDKQTYVVTGTKKWITGAQWASHMTTAVRTGGPGYGGISLLVIPLSAPGVEIEKIHNSGQNAGGASWVRMSEVVVPVENLLGDENAGFKYIMTNFNRERFIMAVGCNRKARTCLSTALEYASTRETFGQPLISHQIIRHKIISIAREVESHWAWLEQIAHHVQIHGWQTDTIAGKIALAKVSGGRILELAAREAQQVMGGVAYQKRGPGGGGVVEQITRDLRMMVVGGGSEEILEDLAFRQEVKAASRKRGALL
ncbi:acyl-CoA dehydrogenase NM domain-like protein [Cryphonectria parasitica EP155]|uniref:Acyl-CoA dehydrogenase NM domain-like protein n=1 Tax=Cryphonectria parasitica (strain ATCC 38755 / EP155) TaxID=660469 RepID=A0A9P4YAZ1_CRYP1|nr:acyl-CoA dehydrogenase NM domain-like protein [Cryphonectria parasitica EP155]KAF3769320.1 acyl-CoA dehydrogenase NM domain-like protein [Cryphonectria parasitica EP155]